MRFFTKEDLARFDHSFLGKEIRSRFGIASEENPLESLDPAELTRVFNRLSHLPVLVCIGALAGHLTRAPKEAREAVLELWEKNASPGVTYEMLERAFDEGIFSDMEDDSDEEG